jgi:hypothetical protein
MLTGETMAKSPGLMKKGSFDLDAKLLKKGSFDITNDMSLLKKGSFDITNDATFSESPSAGTSSHGYDLFV